MSKLSQIIEQDTEFQTKEMLEYEYPQQEYTNNKGINCWKVLDVENRDTYKIIAIQNKSGFSPSKVLVYTNYADYDNVKKGNLIEGFYRNIHGKQYFTDWKRPARSISVGESFTDADNNITQ